MSKKLNWDGMGIDIDEQYTTIHTQYFADNMILIAANKMSFRVFSRN